MYITLGILAVIIVVGIVFYNRFVTLSNRVKESWSDIDVQLKRRYDLIPNLVNTVKGYATHESTAFEKVTQARAASISATGAKAKGEAENMLSGALKSLFAVAEAYPELKANQNFLELQRELSDTENKIQAARRFYNGTTMDMNTAVKSFPSNLIAGMFGFKESEFFALEAADAAAKNPVEVKF